MKDLSPSLYDIAVASLVDGPHQPEHVNWLLTHQNPDGSWGTPYQLSGYDNYICTYAAAIALRTANHPLAESAFELLRSRELWDVQRTPETLTFGGLVDALDKYCRYRDWDVIEHHPFIQSIVSHEQVKWDRMVQWPRFYDPTASIGGYCAERIFGDDRIDLERFMDTFQVRNGSIANAPAASAFAYLEAERRSYPADSSLRRYLYGLQPRTTGYLDHVPHFVTAWAVMFYAEIGAAHHLPQSDIDTLHAALYDSEGALQLLCTVGNTTIPGDTDSAACAILAALFTGHRVSSVDFLDSMFHDNHYQTFMMERDSSLSTNIHMCALLAEYRKSDQLNAVLDWLQHQIVESGKDTCKWHISPMYTMGELARIMARIHHPQAHQLARFATDYLLNRQNADGGWGINSSTVEETGYAVLGLAAVVECLSADGSIHQALTSAAAYSASAITAFDPLWIGKSLYCVEPLVPVLKAVTVERVQQVQSSQEYR